MERLVALDLTVGQTREGSGSRKNGGEQSEPIEVLVAMIHLRVLILTEME